MPTQAAQLRAFLVTPPEHKTVEIQGNEVKLIAPKERDLVELWGKAEAEGWNTAELANRMCALVAHAPDGEKLFDAVNPANLAPLRNAPAGSPLVELRQKVMAYINEINTPKVDGDQGNSNAAPEGGGDTESPSAPDAA